MERKCKVNCETLTLMFVYIGQIFFSPTTLKWSLWSLGNSVFNMISYREAIAVVGLPFNVSGLFGE